MTAASPDENDLRERITTEIPTVESYTGDGERRGGSTSRMSSSEPATDRSPASVSLLRRTRTLLTVARLPMVLLPGRLSTLLLAALLTRLSMVSLVLLGLLLRPALPLA